MRRDDADRGLAYEVVHEHQRTLVVNAQDAAVDGGVQRRHDAVATTPGDAREHRHIHPPTDERSHADDRHVVGGEAKEPRRDRVDRAGTGAGGREGQQWVPGALPGGAAGHLRWEPLGSEHALEIVQFEATDVDDVAGDAIHLSGQRRPAGRQHAQPGRCRRDPLQQCDRRPAGPVEVVEHQDRRRAERTGDRDDSVEESASIVVVWSDRSDREAIAERRQVGRGPLDAVPTQGGHRTDLTRP